MGDIIAIIVAVISLIGVIITTIMTNKTNKKINKENIELQTLYFSMINSENIKLIDQKLLSSQEKNELLILYFGNDGIQENITGDIRKKLLCRDNNIGKNDLVVNAKKGSVLLASSSEMI